MSVSIVHVVQLCLVLLLVNDSNINDAKKIITCDAGRYMHGTPAEITCNFHIDLNATKLGVNVVWYPTNPPQEYQGTDILVCKWEDRTRCRVVRDGYRFNDSRLDPFTLTIPNVTDAFAGLYMCFLVPPGQTDAQFCTLIVKDAVKALSETTTADDENKLMPGIVVLVIIAVAALTLLGILLFFFIRRRHPERNIEAAMCNGSSFRPENIPLIDEQDTQPRPPHQDRQIDDLVSTFRIPLKELYKIMGVFNWEVDAGVTKKEGAKVNIYPTWLRSMPTGRETGDYLVVNLGSKTLKILLIQMKDAKRSIVSSNYEVRSRIRMGASIQLFEFIADSVKSFLREQNLRGKRLLLAFVLAYPLEHYEESDLTKARLVKWTKGFNCRGVVGEDVGQLLQEALKIKLRDQYRNLELRAVVNDCVGILVSVACKDDNCTAAIILGNRFGASFIQQSQEAEGAAAGHQYKVINVAELGVLGEHGSLDDIKTEFDKKLDNYTVNPKEQTLEKMISRAYIGEIARLVLVKLVENRLLFTSNQEETQALQTKYGFRSDDVALIDDEKDEGLSNTMYVLKGLGMENYTKEDCRVVKHVCGVISDRAAHLAAAALATLINRLNKPQVTIATDGSLYRSHRRLQEVLIAKTKELVNPGIEMQFKQSLNGSSIGAALIAAAHRPPGA